jgi:hypothetical protein
MQRPNPRRQRNRKICSRLLLWISIYGMIHWVISQLQLLSSYSRSSAESSSSVIAQPNKLKPPTANSKQNLYNQVDNEKINGNLCNKARSHLQNGGKVLLYNFTSASNGPGMASLTLNMMQLAMYFHERWNRTYTIIDEAQLTNYRWDESLGLYSGYLHPNNCILSEQNTKSSVFQNAVICGHWDMKCKVLEIPADPQGFQFGKARRIVKRYHFKKKQKLEHEPADILRTRFFRDLSQYTCSQLSAFRLRPQVHILVRGILQASKIPVHDIDLAFHIRRGDKVAGARKESRIFHASEYIERFLNQSSQVPSTMKHCFVATDEYSVVTEVKEALLRYHIPCELWTLTPPGYESSWQARDEILGFLAQVQLLVNAKYFTGSFSSNVGGLVALLRGCRLEQGYRGDESNRFNHYFGSYGVDWDEWGIL